MKDLLSFSESERKSLKIGVLVLCGFLFLTNIKPACQGISELSIWQKKPRPAERSPNFKLPDGYTGVWNDLGTIRFVTLDVLVPIYKRIGGAELSQGEIEEIHQSVALAREFFWRNTRLQLNIRPTFVEVGDQVSSDLLDDEGRISPKSGLLMRDLLERGVKKDQYDVVFLFYPSSKPYVFGGSMTLGRSAYGFSSYPPTGVKNLYPDGPAVVWPLALELWHSINTVVYGQDPVEVADWSALATILRSYPVQDPPKPYGRIYLALDYDLDRVPDNDPMVPFNEVSVGLNRETDDSDNDGLVDKLELTAGIFRSADLFLKDTDGDGLEDGEDPYPLDPKLPVEVPSDD